MWKLIYIHVTKAAYTAYTFVQTIKQNHGVPPDDFVNEPWKMLLNYILYEKCVFVYI